jgi:hypothetical protein
MFAVAVGRTLGIESLRERGPVIGCSQMFAVRRRTVSRGLLRSMELVAILSYKICA